MSTENSSCQKSNERTIETVNDKNLPAPANKTWEERVSELESEGLTRSDAQGTVDVEIMQGWRPSDFQPWMNLPMGAGCSYEEMGKWIREQGGTI